VDALSDYDIVVAVEDAAQFVADKQWETALGAPLVVWGDEHELCGEQCIFRGAVYEDGVKVDYIVWPAQLVGRIAELESLPALLDVGYRVLVDKDDATLNWPPASLIAHIPVRPTEGEYLALVDEFWWTTTYVAKYLRRDELLFAKFALDYDIKLMALRRMLDWLIATSNDWTEPAGLFGRGYKKKLPPDMWSALAATYVGPEQHANREALTAVIEIFEDAAVSVAEQLGYQYPREKGDKMRAVLNSYDVVELIPTTSTT
jgi:aminoglycoside 6-adenylyltransferase